MKLGCIGFGNMATAIVGGAVKGGVLPAANVIVFDRMEEKCETAKKQGHNVVASEKEAVERADIVLLAVKPKDFKGLLADIQPVAGGRTFLSIAAGISMHSIETALGGNTPVVRTMPNTPLLLGAGTTAICRNAKVSDEMFAFAKQIFECAGTVYELPEKEYDHVINLNGSSPAYIYLFAKTAAEYAAAHSGIPYNTALSMFVDSLVGSAAMLKSSGYTPDEMITMVSSPGGATVAAFKAFEETGLVKSLESGFEAAVKRAQEMGKD